MTDFSELNDLAADLSHAGLMASFRVRGVLEDWGQAVEDTARPWVPRKRLPHLAGTLNHDVTVQAGAIVGEVGFDRSVNKQANLAHLFEYGTAELAPRASIGPAFDVKTPDAIERLADVAGDVL